MHTPDTAGVDDLKSGLSATAFAGGANSYIYKQFYLRNSQRHFHDDNPTERTREFSTCNTDLSVECMHETFDERGTLGAFTMHQQHRRLVQKGLEKPWTETVASLSRNGGDDPATAAEMNPLITLIHVVGE